MLLRSDIEPLTTLFEPTQNVSDAQEFLGARIVKLTSNHLMVRQHNGSWLEVKDPPTAAQKGRALWVGEQYMPSGQKIVIQEDDVIAFVMAGPKYCKAMVPLISGQLMVPGCDALAVRFEGRRFINTWADTMLLGDEQALNDPQTRQDLETVLRMVREGLSGMDGVMGFDDMLRALHTQDPQEEPFRFVMNWLAAPIQSPGLNLGTNLWLLGPMQGMGRGTLQGLMGRIYGGSLVFGLNYDELNRGWSDQLLNRLLIFVNEPSEGKRRMGDMDLMAASKRYWNEDKIVAATRYHGIGNGEVPNFTNYIGTGNRLRPMSGVDDSDRRHCFIGTSTNAEKKRYSRAVYFIMKDADRAQAVLQALTFVFRSLNIEERLIELPIDTELRRLNIAASQSNENFWLRNDDSYERDKPHLPGYWQERYIAFNPDEPKISKRNMGTMMMQLSQTDPGVVQQPPKQRANGNGRTRNVYTYTVSSEHYPRDPDAQTQSSSGTNGTTTNPMAAAASKLHAMRTRATTAPPLLLGSDAQPTH